MRNYLRKAFSASVMRYAALCMLMLLGVVSARAKDGDTWSSRSIHSSTYFNGSNLYGCYFEVVSEADATVKIIARSDGSNTVAEGRTMISGSMWIDDVVFHNFKTYRIIGIGEGAFKDMPNLVEVTDLGQYIEFIDKEAFYNCPKLESVNMPEGITRIGEKAFMNCTSLTCTYWQGERAWGLYLPTTLQTIQESAFEGCVSLERVYFSSNIETIDYAAFKGDKKLYEVNLPYSAQLPCASFQGCSVLKRITVYEVADKPCRLVSQDGVLFRYLDNGSLELAQFPGGFTDTYVIPDFCTSIGERAFEYSGLRAVTIPLPVKKCGFKAFSECSQLTDVFVEWLNNVSMFGPTDNVFYLGSEPLKRNLWVPTGCVSLYKSSLWGVWFDYINPYVVGNVAGLTVAGSPVKRTEANNIEFPEIKRGRVWFDLVTKTLKLKDVYIETVMNDMFGVGNDGMSNLSIELIGENEFNTNSRGIDVNAITYIKGSGSLKITSNYDEGIYVAGSDLIIDNTKLDLFGRNGAIVGDGFANVCSKNSEIYMRSPDVSGVTTVSGLQKFDMEECYVSSPMFGGFDSEEKTIAYTNVYHYDMPCMDDVEIVPGTFYNFYIDDTPITDKNCKDIVINGLKRGEMRYDPEDNMLTLLDVNIDGATSFLTNNNLGLVIRLLGDNYINTTDDCFVLYSSATMTGTGTLETNVDKGCAVKLELPWAWLFIMNTDVNLKGWRGSIYGYAGYEYQEVTVVNSHVLLSTSGPYDVTSNLTSFKMEDCKFASVFFFFSEEEECICDERAYGSPAYKTVIEITPTGAPTGIDTPEPQRVSGSECAAYNMQGQRVGNGYRGIVIKQGRKYVR